MLGGKTGRILPQDLLQWNRCTPKIVLAAVVRDNVADPSPLEPKLVIAVPAEVEKQPVPGLGRRHADGRLDVRPCRVSVK